MFTPQSRLRRALAHPLLFTFYVPATLFFSAQGLLLPILPLYAGTFEIGYGLIGLVTAALGIGTLLGDAPAGGLVRTLGQRRSLLLGISGSALATMALFGARTIPVVIALLIVSGACQAVVSVTQHTYLADTIAPEKRGRAIAMYGGVYRIGRLVGPALGGALGEALGLRAPFLLYGVLSAAALVIVAARVPATRPTQALAPELPQRRRVRDVILAQRRVLLTGGLAQIGGMMIRNGWAVIIPLYGADVLGLGTGSIGLIVSVMSAMDVSLFYLAGVIMDRFGRKWATVPSFSIQSAGMALVPLTTGPLGLLAAGMVIGLGNGLGSGTLMTLGADLAPAEARSEFLGVWRLIGDVGFTGGPLVVGAVADLLILPAAALVIAAVGLGATLTFAFAVPETLRRSAPVVASEPAPGAR